MSDIKELKQGKKDACSCNVERRKFLQTATGVLSGMGVVCALKPLVSSWLPSAKAQAAGAPVHVDLQGIKPGEQVIVAWRGKPVWVVRRTKKMLDRLYEHETQLRDPDSIVEQQPKYAQNRFRSINPEYLVVIGLCTHLGCSPKYKPESGVSGADWTGGFVCPCHGSAFDLAGRVYKGMPAPVNLEVPPYRFLNEHTLIIGEEEQSGVSHE